MCVVSIWSNHNYNEAESCNDCMGECSTEDNLILRDSCGTAVLHLHKFLVTRPERISGSLLTMITFCNTCTSIQWFESVVYNVRSAIC
jgi:hypothetical protein